MGQNIVLFDFNLINIILILGGSFYTKCIILQKNLFTNAFAKIRLISTLQILRHYYTHTQLYSSHRF